MKNSPRDTDWQDASSAILSLEQHYAIELLLIGKSNTEVGNKFQAICQNL